MEVIKSLKEIATYGIKVYSPYMEDCIIVGAGTYGEVYAQYLKEKYRIIGLVDDNPSLTGAFVGGLKVLGDFAWLLSNGDRSLNVFVPIGDSDVRTGFLNRLILEGFKTPSFIHADTQIHKSVEFGKCVYVLPGTSIMPLTIIGDFVSISMGVNIAHHSKIGDGSFVSQGSNIGAGIELKKNVFCGIGSTIMTGVDTIGEDVLIGAAAVVIKNVPDRAIVVGHPAKVIKYKEIRDYN